MMEPVQELTELRQLLLGAEQEELVRLRERLNDPDVRTEEIAPLLPRILTRSLEANPSALREALAVAVIPIIQGIVSTAFRELLSNLDSVLRTGFSPVSWKWRIEALRSGRPYAEIALLRSIHYRVEQVLLIHRETGLLLCHADSLSAPRKDPDLISAMLVAIRSFIQESFRVNEHARVGSLQHGDLAIYVEEGQHALLAAAVRGTAPSEFRPHMRSALGRIHLLLNRDLKNFNGDVSAFEQRVDVLEDCLAFKLRAAETKPKPVYALVFGAVVLGILALLGAIRIYHAAQLQRLVSALSDRPGIVVLSSSSGLRTLSVSGFRDSLAVDPAAMLNEVSRVPSSRVRFHWQPFLSTAPEIVILRAKQRLNPPASVTLSFDKGTLRLAGVAPVSWTRSARDAAASVPGVDRLDDSGVRSAERDELIRLKGKVEASVLLFPKKASDAGAGQNAVLETIAKDLMRIATLSEFLGSTTKVLITGRADEDGEENLNLLLSRQRAERVRRLLTSRGVAGEMLTVHGAGVTRPVPGGSGDDRKARNRSVTFSFGTGAP